ncbi:hypothetical protein BDV95DRAFT_218982 [Massariosphaeria phaeospora]|uniref:Uncharacterized protein n=1 Tax=Massariosphaeria phaeospora TaxID=100035 RepID=A0A7C8IGQ7_9PLEO|nr:hypothetical protein BDV95DRAFT_218982 [Massariosphaeria phaeospora]
MISAIEGRSGHSPNLVSGHVRPILFREHLWADTGRQAVRVAQALHWSRDQKRPIKQSVSWHRHRGRPAGGRTYDTGLISGQQSRRDAERPRHFLAHERAAGLTPTERRGNIGRRLATFESGDGEGRTWMSNERQVQKTVETSEGSKERRREGVDQVRERQGLRCDKRSWMEEERRREGGGRAAGL